MDDMVEACPRRMEVALVSGERAAFNHVFLRRLEGVVVHVSGARVHVASGQHHIEPTADDLRRVHVR